MTTEQDVLREHLDDALTLAFSPVNGGCGCDYGSVLLVPWWDMFELPGLGKRVTGEFLRDVKGGPRFMAGLLLSEHMHEVHGQYP